MEGWGSKAGLGRPGEPSEVATSFVFLASADASLYCKYKQRQVDCLWGRYILGCGMRANLNPHVQTGRFCIVTHLGTKGLTGMLGIQFDSSDVLNHRSTLIGIQVYRQPCDYRNCNKSKHHGIAIRTRAKVPLHPAPYPILHHSARLQCSPPHPCLV
jgi:hypothetical protein